MKPSTSTAIHAYLMIVVGLYKFSDTSAPIDILMSVIFAVPLLTLNSGVEYGNKPSLNISTLLSMLSIVVFSISAYKEYLKMDHIGLFINGILVITGVLSFYLLILNFINERRKKTRQIDKSL